MPPPLIFSVECQRCGSLSGGNCCSRKRLTVTRTLVGKELGLEVICDSGKVIVKSVNRERHQIDHIKPGWEIRRYDGFKIRTLHDLKMARRYSLSADRSIVDVKFRTPPRFEPTPTSPLSKSHPLHAFHNAYLNHEISKESYMKAVLLLAEEPSSNIDSARMLSKIDNISRGDKVQQWKQREDEATERVYLRRKPILAKQLELMNMELSKRRDILFDEQEMSLRISESSPIYLSKHQLKVREVAEVRSRRFPTRRDPRPPATIPASDIQVCQNCVNLTYLCNFCAAGQSKSPPVIRIA